MMYRYAQFAKLDVSGVGDLSVFPDGKDVSGFAVDAMKWAVGSGLISGNGDGTLNPRELLEEQSVPQSSADL